MSNETYESEKELEERLIKQLNIDGYEIVTINNEDDLHVNFRKQINKHNAVVLNGKELSDKEFDKLMITIMNKGVFTSAKILREKQVITRDDGKLCYIELFNKKEWCKNLFQVTHQVTVIGKYENRYDVTLLINGIPVVQIELKRRGLDFKEAFNQIERYRKHSFKGLFRFIQFFVISNGVDTKYFANGDGDLSFQYTFFWSDSENNRLSNLHDFAMYFLAKCHVAKMIARYMVVDETNKSLMIMRPYQVYAVEKLMDRATETNNNAYVWHTTGSGKTLTSFKLSQLLSNEPNVTKVFFLVDRKDLDSQTMQEFNRFEPDTVDSTDDTKKLIKLIKDPTKTLILTTIQKMANACKDEKYKSIIDTYIDKKVIFIIDECHRSQFGDMHKVINKKFPRAQYFGFTGTPRFPDNPSSDGRTSADIFEKLVHNYLIKDAIKDENVLGFSVDYVKTINSSFNMEDDTKVEAIDTDEVIMADERIEKIANHILKSHAGKTRNGMYNAIFTTKSIEMLIKYYKEFKKHNHGLKIGAIFTFGQNEEAEGKTEHSRDSLEDIIKDYNNMFDTNFSTNTFGNYFADVSKKVKSGKLDILIVVNMFLTGFDAKCLNTLYVDKRLRNHDLIQAFSRTNRIESKNKPYGNIVCYQTTKKSVDDAIKLFSQTNDTETVLMQELDFYVTAFKKAVVLLKKIAPTPNEIIIGGDNKELKEFVVIFRDMVHNLVKMETFVDFEFNEETVSITRQEFEDYKSKYLAISRSPVVKTSILQDIDFCLELIRNDKITVQYIINLIKNISFTDIVKQRKELEEILKLIEQATDVELRSKADLIQSFIERVVPTLDESSSVEDEYNSFMNEAREKEINDIATKFGLTKDKMESFIGEYEFGGMLSADAIKENLSTETIERIKVEEGIPTSIKAKKQIAEKIIDFIKNIITRFI